MRGIKLFLLLLALCSLSGCSGLKEAVKGFAGLSTKALEDARKDAVTRDFNFGLDETRGKIKSALAENGSYIYRDDLSLNLIALYISESDTTPAGVFLTPLDKGNTRVEVSSPSIYGKEVIAKVIFDSLSGIPKTEKRKGIFDAKE